MLYVVGRYRLIAFASSSQSAPPTLAEIFVFFHI